jgi:asparagine synthase (glutamine-hydrolysing)
MCGISGVFSHSIAGMHDVRKSIEAIIHRGPDEQGFGTGENFVLGMCRLAIIDVKHGQQPVESQNGLIKAVFNGEIYNYQELRRELELKGYKFRSDSDSGVIVPLYQEYGKDFAQKMQGMFAIAIYDQEREVGLLVRDRLGKKPLWYSQESEVLKFSSEIKGLLALGVERTPELSNFAEYLQFGYINSPRSAYKDIQQLPPGAILEFSPEITSISRFWSLNEVENLSIGYEEAKQRVHSLLIDAVQSRLISERPIGSFLSGGIDSSLITAIMAKLSGEKIHTYSIGFTDSKFDESSFARAVANEIGTIHHEKIVIPQPELIVGRIAQVLDQPFADSSIIPTFLLSEFARQEVVVALGGDGGDEVFGGYVRYRATMFLDRINFLLALNPSPVIAGLVSQNPRMEKLLRHSRFMRKIERYRNFQSLIHGTEMQKVLSNDLLEASYDDAFMQTWNSVKDTGDLRKLQEVDIATYLPGDLLVKADMASMANSLELRSPFLDYRLVELGVSLPQSFKIQRGVTKKILRDILATYIPREKFERPKMGFGIPRASWLRNELRGLVSDTLNSKKFIERGWINHSELKKIINLHNSGRDLDRIIWPIFMLELWATNWIDVS